MVNSLLFFPVPEPEVTAKIDGEETEVEGEAECNQCGQKTGDDEKDLLPVRKPFRWRTFTYLKNPASRKRTKRVCGRECYECWEFRRKDPACRDASGTPYKLFGTQCDMIFKTYFYFSACTHCSNSSLVFWMLKCSHGFLQTYHSCIQRLQVVREGLDGPLAPRT